VIERGSLRARLLLGAGLWIALALAATGLVLSGLFRAHVTWQYDAELAGTLDQLAALAVLDADGLRLSGEPAGPRFHRPYGGRYWQIDVPGGMTLRSRSLWDQTIPPPTQIERPGRLLHRAADLPGPGRLRVVERVVAFASAPDRPLRLQAALPVAEIDEVAARFDRLLILALGILAGLLLLAAIVQVELGLRPLARLRREVARVRTGEASRLGGALPAEIRPLAEELDALLDDNEAMLTRARTQAADLAHGLKTSLQLIALEAGSLATGTTAERARLIEAEVRRMRAHVDHQLARARAGGQRRGRVDMAGVAQCAGGVVTAVRRLAADRGVTVESRVDPAHRFAGVAADLEEMLGNLLDNATKWAQSRVVLASALAEGRLVLTVDDDGPGLPDGVRQQAFARGTRLDETVPGNGLGLAIVRDLADLYGGRVHLEGSELGGLRARLELPAFAGSGTELAAQSVSAR
jgi:signal transduction histidine kinase